MPLLLLVNPMAFDIKICSMNEAPNLAYGWASAVLSIVDSEGSTHPDFSDKLPHHVATFDNIEDGDHKWFIPIDTAIVESIVEFLDSLDPNAKLLIHSHSGGCRAPSMVYLVHAYQKASPAAALSAVNQMVSKLNLNMLMIEVGEKVLHGDTRHSHFIEKWKEINSGEDNGLETNNDH